MKKIFDNKIVNGIVFLLETIAFIFLFLLLTLTCIQKFSKGGYFFGYQIYTVASSSMIPNYKVGDTLLIKKVPIEEIKVGDAVTYKGEDVTVKNLIITHRVEKIEKGENELLFHTKGIANNVEDPIVYEHQILGKVIYKFYILSIIGDITYDLTKLLIFVTFPIAFLIVVEIVKVVKERDED